MHNNLQVDFQSVQLNIRAGALHEVGASGVRLMQLHILGE